MFFAIALVLAGVSQPPTPVDGRDCTEFKLFADAVTMAGGKITATIETPSFPTVARMIIVTYEGTKEIFAATKSCVLTPPMYVDAPEGLERVPIIKFVPLMSGGLSG